ncbi:MAG: 16S rRNA (guanine(527)-N(7))-methyltransferase RsmG [Chloroflexota bacterium]|nr:16S rRNA (guanine(527)-N(7))-methyltransferase RsmG [Chloroflexota bacterium]|tara:strand:+ start:8861 stop:9556 length:696 start_codon:yes stop_codon:yes gene_type:complete
MIIEKNLNIPLTTDQEKKLTLFSKKIYESNKKFNLTGLKDLESIKNILAYESIKSLDIINLSSSKKSLSVVDIGSGAGIPGIPLKIINSNFHLTFIESNAKKCEFIASACNDLGLEVDIINDRAETIAHEKSYREKFDLVLSRGVANLSTLAEITIPFAKAGGSIISIKGLNISKEIITSEHSVKLLGGDLFFYITTTKYSSIVGWKKVCSTPKKYPRKPGTPQKDPLSLK